MLRHLLPLVIAGSLAAQGAVRWEHDLPAAQARARAEHKLIFMDVWTEWCGWCIKLQRDTFPSAEAQAALNRFVPLSVMTQKKDGTPTANAPLEKRFRVEGFPALYVLDADGRVIDQNPGYLPPKEFAAWLNKVANSQH